MSGWCSSIAATNFSGRHLDAEVDHLEAGALEHDVDEVLADVVDVALDRAHQELADRLHAGLGEQRPQPLHRAGHRAAGDQHLGHEEVAALEAGADLLERGDERVEEQRLRLHVERQALLGQLEDARGVADQGLVVQALEDLFRCAHATPSLLTGVGVRPRSRPERSAAWDDRLRPSSSSRSSSRAVGPEMPRAATTSPRGPWTGTAMPVRPTSSSSWVTAQPRLRVAMPSRRSASGSATVDSVSCSSSPCGHRQRAPGVEDLAERRGVRRDLDLGPVAGAEQVAGVDLGDLDDLLAAGDAQVHGLARCPRRSAPSPAGPAGPAPPTGRGGRRTARRASRRRTTRSRRARPGRCAPARSASARSSTSRGRWPPGGRRR